MALTPDRDAFGHLLDDYLKGEPGLEIVERDDGFIGVSASARTYFAAYHTWPAHEREAMRWARGRVLDIGCGAGRHALYLQGQGYDVTGIDVSPLAIDVCRRRGLGDARVLSLARASHRAARWDTLLLLGANVGLLGSAPAARTLLTRLHRGTGGRTRIIAESRDPSTLADPVHVAYQEANRARGRMRGQLRLRIRYRHYATPWFDYLFLAREELEALLEGSGWGVTACLDAAADGYIALIEKL